jgi:hypothetical protein
MSNHNQMVLVPAQVQHWVPVQALVRDLGSPVLQWVVVQVLVRDLRSPALQLVVVQVLVRVLVLLHHSTLSNMQSHRQMHNWHHHWSMSNHNQMVLVPAQVQHWVPVQVLVLDLRSPALQWVVVQVLVQALVDRGWVHQMVLALVRVPG